MYPPVAPRTAARKLRSQNRERCPKTCAIFNILASLLHKPRPHYYLNRGARIFISSMLLSGLSVTVSELCVIRLCGCVSLTHVGIEGRFGDPHHLADFFHSQLFFLIELHGPR